VPRGDERTSGLLVLSGTAVLDCQLFDYENQVGTEYLFGTLRCPALIEQLGQGVAVISDERAGLNPKTPLVAAFSRAVSQLIAPFVMAEQEKLRHLERATTSGRTAHMIDHLLQRMNQAAIHDFGVVPPAIAAVTASASDGEPAAALRFSTPFYYRPPEHPFHVRLLFDRQQLPDDTILQVEASLSEGLCIDPLPAAVALQSLGEEPYLQWTVSGQSTAERGEIVVRAGSYLAWCEIVIAEQATAHAHHHKAPHPPTGKHRPARDHGEAMFTGYEFRYLGEEMDRAVYSPTERKIPHQHCRAHRAAICRRPRQLPRLRPPAAGRAVHGRDRRGTGALEARQVGPGRRRRRVPCGQGRDHPSLRQRHPPVVHARLRYTGTDCGPAVEKAAPVFHPMTDQRFFAGLPPPRLGTLRIGLALGFSFSSNQLPRWILPLPAASLGFFGFFGFLMICPPRVVVGTR